MAGLSELCAWSRSFCPELVYPVMTGLAVKKSQQSRSWTNETSGESVVVIWTSLSPLAPLSYCALPGPGDVQQSERASCALADVQAEVG